MLRCSNATASGFRTQFTTSLAHRGLSSSSSPRLRNSASLLLPRSPAQVTNIRSRLGTAALVIPPARSFSEDASPRSGGRGRGGAPRRPLRQHQDQLDVLDLDGFNRKARSRKDELDDDLEEDGDGDGDGEGKSRIRKVVGFRPQHRVRHERKAKIESFTKDSHLFLIAKNTAERPTFSKIAKEIQWLKDPLELLKRVDSLLARDQVEMAAALLRQAPREKIDATAAWNSMLRYCFEKDDTKAAMRFWNDMKKRSIKPNSHAYTVMLRGLSIVGNRTENDPVKTALSIYRSVQEKPNNEGMATLIHTNAMLGVCANHVAMDTLWEIAAQLPEDGEGSPDSFTYSIILSAIRKSIQWELQKTGEFYTDRANIIRIKGITEGKRVWVDVIDRWERGQLRLTNQLVSSMAGLLFEGTGDAHLYEVFQLYTQTAGIPLLATAPKSENQLESIRSNARTGTRLSKKQATRENNVPFVDEHGKKFPAFTEWESRTMAKPSEPTLSMTKEELDQLQETVWRQVSAGSSSVGPQFIQMDNRGLSIIMETALQMTQAVSLAGSYWGYLTTPNTEHTVVPDERSVIRYLRILRVARQSRLTVQTLRENMVPLGAISRSVPFHIGMSTCRRDRGNPNVFKHANQILDLMDATLMIPRCSVIDSYLSLIKHLQMNPQKIMALAELEPGKKAKGKSKSLGVTLVVDLLVAALRTLRPHVVKLEAVLQSNLRPADLLSGTHGVPTATVKDNMQSGEDILGVLTRVRQLSDVVLRPTYQAALNKRDITRLQKEADTLKVYSNQEFIHDHRKKNYYPTMQQQKNYYANILAPRKTWLAEQKGTPAEQAGHEESEDMKELYSLV